MPENNTKKPTSWNSWVPILKVADATKSAAFYCEVLGFAKHWEHRFDDGFPLYVEVGRDGLTLHLSEHEGGGTQTGDLYVSVDDVDSVYMELIGRDLEATAPEDREHGERDFCFKDPDGHSFTIGQSSESSTD